MQGLWPREPMLKQLSELNRVLTVKGPLMLDVLHEEIYRLKRSRQEEYGSEVTVDCFASQDTRIVLASVIRDWFASQYGICATQPILSLGIFTQDRPDIYTFPTSNTQLAVFTRRGEYNPILWFIDLANTTPTWQVIEPKRHLVIFGFKGVGFRD